MLRSIRHAAGAALLVVGVAGCGISMPSAGTDAEKTEGTAAGDSASAGGEGNPGIMVTPAAGGGVVVGDPLDAGRAAPTPVAAAPESPAAARGADPSARGADEDDQASQVVNDQGGHAAASDPNPGQASLAARREQYLDPREESELEPAPRAIPPSSTVEPGDEVIPQRGGAAAAGLPGFSTRAPGPTDEAARGTRPGEIVGAEDVDAPPAAARAVPTPDVPNAGFAGPRGRFEGGDEDFQGIGVGGAGVQPAESIEIKRGSAEEVATTFLSLVAAGDLERATPLIASRATGVLARLRAGTATPAQIDELKAVAAARQQESSRSTGSLRRITYRADNKMLLVEAEQKDADASIVKLDIRNAPRRRNN